MRYRSDIDGLRALAVLSVVFYHAKFALFTGGFVGVDVFFVLSGFLITGVIKADLEDNSFSFLSFYERRVRRIFPILLAVIVFTAAVGLSIFLFYEYALLGREIIASIFFAENIALYRGQGDYFSPISETNPLLHLWSLSIEEQFYIFYPAILFLMWRYARPHILKLLALIAVLSLLWAESNLDTAPTAVFFLPHYRIWELLIGCMIHFIPHRDRIPRALSEGLGVVGLAMILYPMFAYGSKTKFPGVGALLPTLGTAATILAGFGHPTLVSRLLSLRPLTWIGGMSYGIYLWHWPLLSIAALISFVEISNTDRIMLIGAALFLSWASLQFLETPFRTKQYLKERRRLFVGIAGAALAIVVTAQITRKNSGWIGQVLWRNQAGEIPTDCSERICSNGESQATNVVLGDSHGYQLLPALAKWDPNVGWIFQPGCPPLADTDPRFEYNRLAHCNTNKKLDMLIADKSIKTVILAGRWQSYYDGAMRRTFGTTPLPVVLCNGQGCAKNESERHEFFSRGLSKTLMRLKEGGKNVLIVGVVPTPVFHVPRMIRLEKYFKVKLPPWPLTTEDTKSLQNVESTLNDVAGKFGLEVLNPAPPICGKTHCRYLLNGESLFADENHLSPVGADLVWNSFIESKRVPASEKSK